MIGLEELIRRHNAALPTLSRQSTSTSKISTDSSLTTESSNDLDSTRREALKRLGDPASFAPGRGRLPSVLLLQREVKAGAAEEIGGCQVCTFVAEDRRTKSLRQQQAKILATSGGKRKSFFGTTDRSSQALGYHIILTREDHLSPLEGAHSHVLSPSPTKSTPLLSPSIKAKLPGVASGLPSGGGKKREEGAKGSSTSSPVKRVSSSLHIELVYLRGYAPAVTIDIGNLCPTCRKDSFAFVQHYKADESMILKNLKDKESSVNLLPPPDSSRRQTNASLGLSQAAIISQLGSQCGSLLEKSAEVPGQSPEKKCTLERFEVELGAAKALWFSTFSTMPSRSPDKLHAKAACKTLSPSHKVLKAAPLVPLRGDAEDEEALRSTKLFLDSFPLSIIGPRAVNEDQSTRGEMRSLRALLRERQKAQEQRRAEVLVKKQEDAARRLQMAKENLFEEMRRHQAEAMEDEVEIMRRRDLKRKVQEEEREYEAYILRSQADRALQIARDEREELVWTREEEKRKSDAMFYGGVERHMEKNKEAFLRLVGRETTAYEQRCVDLEKRRIELQNLLLEVTQQIRERLVMRCEEALQCRVDKFWGIDLHNSKEQRRRRFQEQFRNAEYKAYWEELMKECGIDMDVDYEFLTDVLKEEIEMLGRVRREDNQTEDMKRVQEKFILMPTYSDAATCRRQTKVSVLKDRSDDSKSVFEKEMEALQLELQKQLLTPVLKDCRCLEEEEIFDREKHHSFLKWQDKFQGNLDSQSAVHERVKSL